MGDKPISLIIFLVIATVVIVCVLAGLVATFGVVGLVSGGQDAGNAAQGIGAVLQGLLGSK